MKNILIIILFMLSIISCKSEFNTEEDQFGIIVYQSGDKKFYLRNDFGLIVKRRSPFNSTEFLLFNAKNRSLYRTYTYENLIEKIRQTIPPGKRLDSYAPCSNNFHQKNEMKYLNKLKIFSKSNKIIFVGTEDPENIMCTCQ